MKKTKILYWIFTGVVILTMGVFSIFNVIGTEDSVKIFNDLHYPLYIMPFLGIAKILGTIAILIPGYPRVKEWAYAGLTFDVLGAWYSAIAMGTPFAQHIFMGMFLVPIIGSYICYHKLAKEKAVTA
ncbi:MAG: DoxX family protein [Bacteroidota bacterium]